MDVPMTAGIPFSKPIEKEPLGQRRSELLNNPCNKLSYMYHLQCSNDSMSKQCLNLLQQYKQCETDYEQSLRIHNNPNYQ